jgi:hypothetical protein
LSGQVMLPGGAVSIVRLTIIRILKNKAYHTHTVLLDRTTQ